MRFNNKHEVKNYISAVNLLASDHSNHYSKAEKKVLRNWYKSIYDDKRDDALVYKARVARKIEENRVGNELYVYVWSRDCDMCEGSSRYTIPASVLAYEKFCNDQYECAEGPMRINIMSRTEYDEFEPHFRDLALEAFENGHPHVVYP